MPIRTDRSDLPPLGAPRTAGVVIVGNEVLSGKVVEQNAAFFVRELRALGVRLCEVAFVEDRRDAIAECVARMAARFDVVCTTGGIGPTHDDVTLDALALAFGRPLVERPELVAAMGELLGPRLTPAHRRMARVPEGTALVPGDKLPWPGLRLDNVWIFPGIPAFVRAQFSALAHHLGAGPPLFAGALDLAAEETAICERLDAVVARHSAVEIGPYPRWEAGRWRLRLTAEGPDAAAVEAAWRELAATFADDIDAREPVRAVRSGPPLSPLDPA